MHTKNRGKIAPYHSHRTPSAHAPTSRNARPRPIVVSICRRQWRAQRRCYIAYILDAYTPSNSWAHLAYFAHVLRPHHPSRHFTGGVSGIGHRNTLQTHWSDHHDWQHPYLLHTSSSPMRSMVLSPLQQWWSILQQMDIQLLSSSHHRWLYGRSFTWWTFSFCMWLYRSVYLSGTLSFDNGLWRICWK